MMTNPEKRAGPPPIFDTPATPSISDALSRVRHEQLPPPRIVSPMTQGLGRTLAAVLPVDNVANHAPNL